MLTHKNRLLKQKDFNNVFENGKQTKHGFLLLKFIPNNLPESRFGFIISKKVNKSAVKRNKIKRKARQEIKRLLPLMKKGHDIVLIVLSEKENIQEELKIVFQKAKLL